MLFNVGDILQGRYNRKYYRVTQVLAEDYVIRRVSTDDYTVDVGSEEWWYWESIETDWELIKAAKVDPLKKLSGFGRFVRGVAA